MAMMSAGVKRASAEGRPLARLVSTVIVCQSAVILPLVPVTSTRFTSGELQSERETSPMPLLEGISTLISSTPASRTWPRLNPATLGFPGFERK